MTSLTRLDRVGVPVASAIRTGAFPGANSVHSGAALSEQEALVAALCETLERYAAEPRGHVPLVKGAPDPEYELGTHDELCCVARGLLSGTKILVPAVAAFFPWKAPSALKASTNGLAFAPTLEQASLSALLECVERDSMSRALCWLVCGKGDAAPAVSHDSLCGEAATIVAHVRAAGLRVSLADVTGDVGVPVIHATIWEELPDGSRRAHRGMACRPNAADAAAKALLEAIQSRLVEIQGAREDFTAVDDVPVDPWFYRAAPGSASLTYGDGDEWSISAICQRIDRLSLPEPVMLDLTPPDYAGRVARVISPGLEICAIDPTRVGRRAVEWANGQ